MRPVSRSSEAATAQPSSRVRPAQPGDCRDILRLVQALAEYEREPDAVEGTVADLHAALFAEAPQVFCHVAEVRTGDGWQVAGMAIWYVTFSTWKVRHGIWLEDLFVEPEHRQLGLGRMLLAELGRVCVERGYPRLEWWVLDWNEPAHRFYEQLGAVAQDEWTVWRVDGEPLARLGAAVAGA
jgi:GNAT superfamily N-acetyltransferase